MIIKCKVCQTTFNFNEEKFIGKNIKFKCPRCGNFIELDLRNYSKKTTFQHEQFKSSQNVSQNLNKKDDLDFDIDSVIKKLNDLPTLPIVIQRILELVNDPNTSINQMTNIITSDQSLTAKTLKLVNSAFYGFEKKIKTVKQAIIIIGFDAVKNLALSASVFDVFKSVKQRSNFQREAFWQHSFGVAVASKIISEDTLIGVPGELFVAGLLHDIGKIVLDAYFPKQMDSILYNISKSSTTFVESERILGKIDHTQIGFRLGKKWKLPDELIYPIRFHHDPIKTEKFRNLVSVVHLANIVAKLANIGYDGYNTIPKISKTAWTTIAKHKPDISKSDIKKYIIMVQQQLENNEIASLAVEQ